jgi:hypothetical protein
MDFLNQTSGARTQEIAFCGKIGYTPSLFYLPLVFPQTATFKLLFLLKIKLNEKPQKVLCFG